MNRVAIFFFLPSLGGGSTTFTAHLHEALRVAGVEPMIYRVKKRQERTTRPFGQYDGVQYRNITPDTALKIVKKRPSVMAAPAHSKYLVEPDIIRRLMDEGMRIVIHDPNEFKVYDHLKQKLPRRPICIRPSMRQFFKTAHWIPHPYHTVYGREHYDPDKKRKNAVSVARIASVKRPTIILEANRHVPAKKRVELLGAEHRLYTRGLQERYPTLFKQSGRTLQFPMTFAAPVDVCRRYRFNVDMTWFPHDGGGTQYAQMEAMDAGTINIMNRDWFRIKGELDETDILTVKGPKGLAKILKNGIGSNEEHRLRERGWQILGHHSPFTVGKLYLEELNR